MVLDPTKYVIPSGAPALGQQVMISAPNGPAEHALIGDPVNVVNLFVGDSLVDQLPVGEDTPLQITFGPAIGTGGDPVQLLANGGVQVNTPGSYFMTHNFTIGRTSSGQSAQVDFRFLIDGVQIGNTAVYKMDSTDQSSLLTFTTLREYSGGEVLTHEIARDTAGPDEGGLFALPVSIPGWNSGFSAQVSVNRVTVG